MKFRVHRGLVSTGAIALATIFVLPFGQAANAQTAASNTTAPKPGVINSGQLAKHGWNLVPGAAKSLNVKEPYRHTSIHLTPPVQWYEKHSVGCGWYGIFGSAGANLHIGN